MAEYSEHFLGVGRKVRGCSRAAGAAANKGVERKRTNRMPRYMNLPLGGG